VISTAKDDNNHIKEGTQQTIIALHKLATMNSLSTFLSTAITIWPCFIVHTTQCLCYTRSEPESSGMHLSSSSIYQWTKMEQAQLAVAESPLKS
jgi:hypothetical protein